VDTYYETALTLTSQFYFCGLPLRLDAYSYCSYGCRYCFAKYRGGNFRQPLLKCASPRALRRWLALADARPKPNESILVEFLRQRVPIHFGGMTDPFPSFERRLGVSFELLGVLESFSYPVVISTKSPIVAETKYLDILRRMKYRIVQVSLSCLSGSFTRSVERNTPSPEIRLKVMKTLADAGVPVFCRIQPFFPSEGEDTLRLISRLSSSGCRHVAVEHLKLPIERRDTLFKDLSKALGTDPWEQYRRQGAKRIGREWVLPADMKKRNVGPLIEATRVAGMTFGAADNELQYLSDTRCCCSGVDQIPGFGNFFRHQIGYAIREARGRKEIRYDTLVDQWCPRASPDRFLNSNTRRIGPQSSTMADYIRSKWNSPGTQNAPSSWLGVRNGERLDRAGNTVYIWSGEEG
jgi:DNA repair photolyase